MSISPERSSTQPDQLAMLKTNNSGRDDIDIDRAVAAINKIFTAKGLETARLIGQFIVDTFFDGETPSMEKDDRSRVTFRRLAEHPDLQVSHSFLWYSVAIVEQLKVLPDELANLLPLSHHRLLVSVRDHELKVELAALAVRQDLSKRDLEIEIAQRRSSERGGRRVGRPPVPEFIKSLGRLQKVLDNAVNAPVRPESFQHFSRDTATRLMDDLDRQAAQMESIRTYVRRRFHELGLVETREVASAAVPPGEQHLEDR